MPGDIFYGNTYTNDAAFDEHISTENKRLSIQESHRLQHLTVPLNIPRRRVRGPDGLYPGNLLHTDHWIRFSEFFAFSQVEHFYHSSSKHLEGRAARFSTGGLWSYATHGFTILTH